MVCAPCLLDHLQRDAAAHGGQLYDRAARALDGGDDFLRDGQVHGRADGVVSPSSRCTNATLGWARAASLVGRRAGDEVALRADVVDHALLLRLPVEAFDQAHVDIDGGG